MVKYAGACDSDKDCPSRVCEMTYDNLERPKERMCVKQDAKYGKDCLVNSDCPSNRCVVTYASIEDGGLPTGQKCVVIKGQKPADTNLFGKDQPKWLNDDEKAAAIKRDMVIINPYVKEHATKGKGPVAKVTITVIEFMMHWVFETLKLMWNIWQATFFGIYNLLFSKWQGPLGNDGDEWRNQTFTDVYGEEYPVLTCNDSIPKYVDLALLILFPPFNVFMHRGIKGWQYIVTCCLLTMMFYFPGLMYAFIIKSKSEFSICPNSTSKFSLNNSGQSIGDIYKIAKKETKSSYNKARDETKSSYNKARDETKSSYIALGGGGIEREQAG